jgi:hypothetical protein
MKTALFLVFSLMACLGFAGINGSSGNSVGQLVTVEVCDLDIAGVCKMVTYQVRPPSQPEKEEKCMIPSGEAGEVPCPTQYGVPPWLIKEQD